jgi:hypothetical protein
MKALATRNARHGVPIPPRLPCHLGEGRNDRWLPRETRCRAGGQLRLRCHSCTRTGWRQSPVTEHREGLVVGRLVDMFDKDGGGVCALQHYGIIRRARPPSTQATIGRGNGAAAPCISQPGVGVAGRSPLSRDLARESTARPPGTLQGYVHLFRHEAEWSASSPPHGPNWRSSVRRTRRRDIRRHETRLTPTRSPRSDGMIGWNGQRLS